MKIKFLNLLIIPIVSLLSGASVLAASNLFVIGNIATNQLGSDSESISWTSSSPSTSVVRYGTSQDYDLTASDDQMSVNHNIVLKSLDAGTTYHFIVKGTDANGQTVSSPDSSFRTKGTTVNITLTNQKGKALSGAKLTLDKQTARTDSKGQASFKDLAAGEQKVNINYAGKDSSEDIVVSPIDANNGSQEIPLQITVSPDRTLVYIAAAFGALLLAFLLWIWKQRRNTEDTTQAPPVV